MSKLRPPIVVYGIENCDQVRKARQWLKSHEIDYKFHDFRKDGLNESLLADWLSHVPWDALLNRRGMTWRKLTEQQRSQIVDQGSAVEVMIANPSVIKRPVLQTPEHLLVGFSQTIFEATFKAHDAPSSKA